jgi:ribosomal protein L12E/L44/L45/RPP1/RPP2
MRPLTGLELETAFAHWQMATVGHSRLDEIRAAMAVRALLDQSIIEAVSDARSKHATWAMVGDALGTTRQGARKRYGS